MIILRKSEDRGQADFGWLRAKQTFSFGEYHDPDHMGFRSLRVINEDRINPGKGFGMHPHRDMEIVSFVIKGQLEHKDNMGNGEIMRPGVVQAMSAGRGVLHSEFNPSDEVTHLMQVWIQTAEKGIDPRYDQKDFGVAQEEGLRLLVSEDGEQGSVRIHQDAKIYEGQMDEGESVSYPLAKGRGLWLQVVHGSVSIDGEEANTGDGLAIENVEGVEIESRSGDTHFFLFDVK